MKAKATELMIGDWVYGLVVDEGNDLDKIIDRVPSKVTMINEFGDIYTQGPFPIDDEEYDGEWEWYDIEPIPLTPEILEKSGFENNAGESSYYHSSREVSINSGCNGFWGVYIRNGCAFSKCIKYVHELQHALRLCGIDKEITI